MNLRRFLKGSLYWRLILSYLLVILAVSGTLYVASQLFAPLFLARHINTMVRTSHNLELALTVEPEEGQHMLDDLERAYTRAVGQSLFWGLAIAVIVASGIGFFVTKRIVTPLKAMQRASKHIASGYYHERLNILTFDEIGELATTFNAMAATLEQVEAQRVELLSNLAHEFKTPLSSLRGYIDGIEDGLFKPDGETMTACRKQLFRLEYLLRDLALLSKVESGQDKLKPQVFQVKDLFDQVLSTFKPHYETKKVALLSELSKPDLCVYADLEKSVQILSNLILNALRHTPEGGEVNVTAKEQENHIHFTVEDNGMGIATEHLSHVFTRFFRGDEARQQDGSGSGIGLTIAKHYVEAHGGKIGVSSKINHGSRFYFDLPCRDMIHHVST